RGGRRGGGGAPRGGLGHTGHDLAASAATQLIYALVVVAAGARIAAALMTAGPGPLLGLAPLPRGGRSSRGRAGAPGGGGPPLLGAPAPGAPLGGGRPGPRSQAVA